MQQVVHVLRQIARHEAMQRNAAYLGVVKSVQGGPDDHSCTVELRESHVVLPNVPIAVGFMGFACLPAEGDLVAVLFLGGDLHAPIVVGRLYTQDLKPPQHGPGELVMQLPVSADSDKRIELRLTTPDGGGSRSLSLVLDGDVRVSVDIADDGITLAAQDASLKLSQTSGSDGEIAITVGEAKMTFSQSGDVSLETSGKLTLKGQSVEISGDASVKVAGQTIDLN
jgi:uncharacterized protein involved in type VI secretion and phage assembly